MTPSRRFHSAFALPCLLLSLSLGGCLSARDYGGPAPAPAMAPALPSPPATAGGLPVDPAITAGRLENGLSYYIRPNSEPGNRAEVWLVLNAGSLLEDEDQRGLAHFVEHMAFNGTAGYAKQEIVDFLEMVGMQFGPDVNAYTSFDETVYTLTVPTDDPAIVSRSFDILAEWAGGVAFEEEEIDKERGVVIEEWRLGRGAGSRLRDKQFPVIFKGSRYATRLPVGDKEILESAPHEAVRRFYRDWYRPDLMAVIAVGDFEPKVIEDRIRESFGSLENPESSRERRIWPVPDHQETLVTVETDPEATSTGIRVYYKLPKRPDFDATDYRRILVESLYHGMLNDRLQEITEEPDPPFLFAFSTSGSLVRTRDIYLQVAGVRDGELSRGLEALLTEAERVDRFGFTATELERARKDVLRSYEQAYRERDKLDSSVLADEIRRHFLEGEPMPGIEVELDLVRRFLPEIGLDEVNRSAAEWISEENRVIAVSAPENGAGPPATEREILSIFDKVDGAGLDPWIDRVVDQPLLPELPGPGTLVGRSTEESVGTTTWSLSNGVRVVLKPTDFKNDEILMSGYSPGGHSLVEEEDHPSAVFADSIAGASGLGAFDATELKKALAGTVAGASVSISELEEGVSGSASPEDLETMFQLAYLHFTEPRFDEDAFRSLKTRLAGFIENRLASPETVFSDRMGEAFYQGHPRRRPLTREFLEEVSLESSERVYRQRFADAGDFTFHIVGNFELEGIRPLVLRYLGGLPATGRKESWRDVGVRPPGGVVEIEVKKGLEPKSRVSLTFTGEAPWSRQEAHDISSLAALLRLRLREVLREEMGGTYGVSVSGSISRRPAARFRFTIGFGCAPESVEELLKAVFNEVAAVKESGAGAADIAKITEGQRRRRETNLRENGFWLAVLESYDRFGEDPALILEYDELVESLSSDRMRAAAVRYLDTGGYVQGVLNPESP